MLYHIMLHYCIVYCTVSDCMTLYSIALCKVTWRISWLVRQMSRGLSLKGFATFSYLLLVFLGCSGPASPKYLWRDAKHHRVAIMGPFIEGLGEFKILVLERNFRSQKENSPGLDMACYRPSGAIGRGRFVWVGFTWKLALNS